ncbi:hypothetical protein SAMN05446037_1006133 [Anaerovirgula multivorans]|uniref:Uncharacterized protein n=1 Tax=Anaerovirgula multivorans TaxID=312168 RepID=A0A239CU43_9FIRM|nr:hypothetical protein [Anaerovirgula multivorans]SNS23161.1 hypothetical protein SAMN05446037_1006133 [Anaerovirgula multivorans]
MGNDLKSLIEMHLHLSVDSILDELSMVGIILTPQTLRVYMREFGLEDKHKELRARAKPKDNREPKKLKLSCPYPTFVHRSAARSKKEAVKRIYK